MCLQLDPVRKVSKFAVELMKPSEQGKVVPKSKVSFGLTFSIFTKLVVSAVLRSKSPNLEEGHLPEMCTHDSAGRGSCWVVLPNGRNNKD